MKSILVQVLAQSAMELKLWKWIAIISIALHLLRSF
jgi:hypothetical protein